MECDVFIGSGGEDVDMFGGIILPATVLLKDRERAATPLQTSGFS